MGLNCCFSWINRFRTIISIWIGVISIVSWIYSSYRLEKESYPIELIMEYAPSTVIPGLAMFICYLLCTIFSAVMVFGVVKKIANCILPWLAIHVAMAMSFTVNGFCLMFYIILVESSQILINYLILTIVFSCALIFSWAIVYPYWKSLAFSEKMNSSVDDRRFICINRLERLISICAGVLCMILWIFFSYQLGDHIYHRTHDNSEEVLQIVYLALTPLFILFLICVVFSALLVFGAIKKSAKYMLPWLASHFVTFMYIFTKAVCHIGFFIPIEDKQDLLIPMVLNILASVGLIFSMGFVYRFWKSLLFPTEIPLTCPKVDHNLKTRNETKEEND